MGRSADTHRTAQATGQGCEGLARRVPSFSRPKMAPAGQSQLERQASRSC
ncbi:hypothetical protein VFPBJ_06143 [Purpureocillium lilacinum]|uniref:Uncharacterized protein n=1 Tax=Purpureocillium lilacinum TaxID=33203 RepID=A0A179GSV2_PURLI|nr:hypothetical protein VFPBJ_06143 [Purpureocillium lilacinum]